VTDSTVLLAAVRSPGGRHLSIAPSSAPEQQRSKKGELNPGTTIARVERWWQQEAIGRSKRRLRTVTTSKPKALGKLMQFVLTEDNAWSLPDSPPHIALKVKRTWTGKTEATSAASRVIKYRSHDDSRQMSAYHTSHPSCNAKQTLLSIVDSVLESATAFLETGLTTGSAAPSGSHFVMKI